MTEKILIIKLGALGDFIQACGPMAAIRDHHKQAHITLLTTAPFHKLAEKIPYCDEVIIDARPRFFDLPGWFRLFNVFNQQNFDRVYDLQNNDRTRFYFCLFSAKNKPEWVGTAKGASHQNTSPERTAGHAFDGHVQTLSLAGIKRVEIDDLSWMDAPINHINLHKPYALLVPGASPGHPQKRWAAEHYGRLAKILYSDGLNPVIIGTHHEDKAARTILEHCPEALDLTDQTSLFELTALARNSAGAIGNDTGPMHLIAATGCPCLTLFSLHSDPVRHKPKGLHVKVLQTEALDALTPEKVFRHFTPRLIRKNPKETIH